VDEKKLNNVNRGDHRDSKHTKVWANNTFWQMMNISKLRFLKIYCKMYLRMKILLWDLVICCHYWFSNLQKKTQVSILQLGKYTNLVLWIFLVLLFFIWVFYLIFSCFLILCCGCFMLFIRFNSSCVSLQCTI
jgi:hypothetical protein